jgi:hypothetical protein
MYFPGFLEPRRTVETDRRNAKAAKRFLVKALRRNRDRTPQVINRQESAYGEVEVECRTLFIDGAVEALPAPLDPHISLINPPGSTACQ